VANNRPSYRVLLFAFGIGLLQVIWFLGYELYRFKTLSQQAARLDRENQQLWREVRELEAELRETKKPEFKEAEARRLGLVRSDEILYPR